MSAPRPGRTAALLLAGAAVLAGMLPGVPAPARAARWEMTTRATYEVQPGDGRVEVSVRVIFRNTTPNPPGRFSVYEVIDLAIQDGARDIEARDYRGRLAVSTERRADSVRVSVRPRRGVRYRDRAAFVLTYKLPDGASGVRVGPTVVTFPVWAFGTEGSAAVTMPGRYDVSVDGDELTPERTAEGWRLDSGDVRDPQSWASRVLAVAAAGHETMTEAVPLANGTVELQVRAWADDDVWGERTLDLLVGALPLLEEELGLPYPGAGPLVVEEVVSRPQGGGLDEAGSEGTHVLAGYDQPSFTLLHQVSHVWLSDELAADRWIREGFASWAAAGAAEEMGVELPYRPATRRSALRDDAFPLISWGAGASTPAQDAYAYAASWAVADRLAGLVGLDRLRLAWQRVAAGEEAYEPVTDAIPAVDAPAAGRQPVDSRALLDHLETVSGEDLGDIFATWVFDEATAALLPERARAKAEYEALLVAAGDWGAPMPVTTDLAAWRFDSARDRMAESMAWLVERDALADQAAAAGLALPQRLRDRYRTAGGGPDARTELEAETAVVRAYSEALSLNAAERDLFERIGLVGGADRDALLRQANQAFAEGDLRGAADASNEALAQLENARTQGIVRIAAALALAIVLLVAGIALVRRRRVAPTSDYTAAP